VRIIFRCDASTDIGSGHVTRCLTLATVLSQKGAHVTFICRDYDGNLLELIRDSDFEVVVLPSGSNDGIITVSQDACEIAAIIGELGSVDWLVVDSYELDIAWEAVQRKYVKKIMVIDDLANRNHDCDLLLDENLFSDVSIRYKGLIPSPCEQLLGSEYSLLREEFRLAHGKHSFQGNLQRLFVFFGGSDLTNETAKILAAIKEGKLSQLIVDVVIGSSNRNREEIAELCHGIPHASLYRQIKNMADLMMKADFSIGGGGMTAGERCCVGLPSIVVPVAENQVVPMQQLAKAGAIVLYSGKKTVEGYGGILQEFLAGKYDICSLVEKGIALYDGQGAQRVVQKMLEVN